MRYKIVAVRDRALDVFSVPTFVMAIGGAIRSFQDEVRRPGSEDRPNPLSMHPDDFDLFSLGEYDDETGMFTQDASPRQIAVGKDLIK